MKLFYHPSPGIKLNIAGKRDGEKLIFTLAEDMGPPGERVIDIEAGVPPVIHKVVLDLNEAKANRYWSDYTLITLVKQHQKWDWDFLFPKTLASRLSFLDYAMAMESSLPIMLLVPFASASLDDCGVVIGTDNGYTASFEGQSLIQVTDRRDATKAIFPMITGSATSISGGVRIDFTVTDPKGDAVTCMPEVYVDVTAGFASASRVKLDAEGRGQVVILSQGVASGLSGKAKLGFKYFTSVVEVPYTLP